MGKGTEIQRKEEPTRDGREENGYQTKEEIGARHGPGLGGKVVDVTWAVYWDVGFLIVVRAVVVTY